MEPGALEIEGPIEGPMEGSDARDGAQVLRLRGRARTADAGRLRAGLARARGDGPLRLDLSAVEALEGGAAAVLADGLRRARERREVEVVGASSSVEAALALFRREPRASLRDAGRSGLFEDVGRATVGLVRGTRGSLSFVGQTTLAVLGAARRPRSVPWRDVLPLMERNGADSLPIVVLITGLMGLVTAYQASTQLQRFGADVFVADLTALSITRELGPLMTAIIVAGRSGAAFAAELGTMKVSEEVDALRALGLEPHRYLVLPRTLALVAMMPLLTLIGDVVGIAGGGVAALAQLDVSFSTYVSRTREAIDLWDVFGGVLKSVVFGILIALVGCERGLAARGGAAGVGRSTTSAVVAILFFIILADALFSVLYHQWGI